MSRSVEDLQRDAWLAEAESLAQLTSHPAWLQFESLLVQMRLSAMEQLAVSDPADVRFWQGMAAGLREIKERPGQIVAVARQVLDEEAQRRTSERSALDFAAGVHVAEDDL